MHIILYDIHTIDYCCCCLGLLSSQGVSTFSYGCLTFCVKVVKLHTKLGKPIPSTEPVLVNTSPAITTSTAGKPPAPSPAGTSTTLTSSATSKQTAINVNNNKVAAPVKKPPLSRITLCKSLNLSRDVLLTYLFTHSNNKNPFLFPNM